MNKPDRHSVLGALSALTRAENGGDVIDEVFILCDALGIERPVDKHEDGVYSFPWDDEDE